MKNSILVVSFGCVASASALLAAYAAAEPANHQAPAAQEVPAMTLPPGWTIEDVQACMVAGQPGDQHAYLAESVGVWEGTTTMVMAPGTPEVKSNCVTSVTSVMGGRYVQVLVEGEMPGMGPYRGQGLYGFDNVSGQYTAVWIDNMGTGMMTGTGHRADDGKSLTITYTYNCPITKKPAPMREVETVTGENSKRLEMYAKDPKTGVEYKMMTIEYVRKS